MSKYANYFGDSPIKHNVKRHIHVHQDSEFNNILSNVH